MDQAVKYVELMAKFKTTLETSDGSHTVNVIDGRRFDRIALNNKVKYFVDRNSWEIYGAKSSFQYNPRRWFGTLNSVDQYTWTVTTAPTPKAGTEAEQTFTSREAAIVKNYKPRGRPRKHPLPSTNDV